MRKASTVPIHEAVIN